MNRLILWVFLVALGIGAVMLLLFTLRIAVVLVFVALLCLGAAALMGWLSVKRLRSTRATRRDDATPTTT